MLIEPNATVLLYFKLISLFEGGTIGLFTGMSFLSMIEVLFWVSKILISSCFMQKPSRANKNQQNSVTNRQKVYAKVKTFFEVSSTHGLVYFFKSLTIVERGFWIFITCIMISMGAIWVNTLR